VLNRIRPIRNRPLFTGNLICVQNCSKDTLTVGRRPWIEKIALVILLVGLVLIGLPLAAHTLITDIVLAEFVPGSVLTLVGIWFLFLQTRLVFEAKTRQIILVRPTRRPMRWSWDYFKAIEVHSAWNIEDVKLVLKNGSRMTLFQTRWNVTGAMPQDIANFMNLPLERKQLT
jgi:hypothetical protein